MCCRLLAADNQWKLILDADTGVNDAAKRMTQNAALYEAAKKVPASASLAASANKRDLGGGGGVCPTPTPLVTQHHCKQHNSDSPVGGVTCCPTTLLISPKLSSGLSSAMRLLFSDEYTM